MGSSPDRSLVGILAAVLVVAGCGQTAATAPTPQVFGPSGVPQQRASSWMDERANPHRPWLYVSDATGNFVSIYSFNKSGAKIVGQITVGLNGPFGMAIDKSGNLYVANQNAPGNVVVYPPGQTSPSLTLTADLSTPQGVAVDDGGYVYVTNRGNPSGIAVYPPGSSQPSHYITSTLIQSPIQDVFDGAGNLYFSDPLTGVSEIAKGTQQPSSLGLKGLAQATGIALTASDHLYVNNYRSGGRYVARVYSLGLVNPRYDLKQPIGAYYLASGYIGLRQFVFVPDWFSNRVFLFKDGSRKPFSILTTLGHNAVGVAFKPAGVP